MFVCSNSLDALKEGAPTGPTTPGTPVSQIDTPPTIATPEDSSAQLPGTPVSQIDTPPTIATPGTPVSQIDTPPTIATPEDSSAQLPRDNPDQPSWDAKQGKESDTEVGETEVSGRQDGEGATDSPEHETEGKGEVAVDVQVEGDVKQPDPGVHNVEDMPSFEEWKRQMLDKQQAELVEKSKQLMGGE